ncbi:hypothetical protein [Sediminibacillus sp. JSM 1682029]|uniref:hypothetical protein n=1 Tax=Sediminibacillus sp. JSM 1682029 TaxID=3229857 RepID=UPI0035250187
MEMILSSFSAYPLEVFKSIRSVAESCHAEAVHKLVPQTKNFGRGGYQRNFSGMKYKCDHTSVIACLIVFFLSRRTRFLL